MFPILRHSAAGDGQTFLCQFLFQQVVAQRFLFVFVVDKLFKGYFYLACRQLFAVARGVSICKEETQGERTPLCLCILDVANTRDGRDVQSRAVGDVLENHRPQVSLVALNKELSLYVDDGLHR